MPLNSRIIKYDVLDSTNMFALRNFASIDDGTVITAEKQTSGRGRLDRKWLSEGKGIYFTVVLKKAGSASIYAAFSHLMSVSVCEALAGTGLKPQIKWPNDVLCVSGDHAYGYSVPGKICGILSQAAAGAGGLCGIALGAGINYSQSEEDFKEIMYPAVSVKMLKKEGIPSKDELLSRVLENFFKRKEIFERHGFPSIYEEYAGYCYFIGKEIKISVPGGKEKVFAEGINRDGTLSVIRKGVRDIITAADILP